MKTLTVKSIFSIAFICLYSIVSTSTWAQNGEITNEKVWFSREFSPEYVSGINSMKDGIHYTSLESSEENGSEIVKYSYETGKKVEVLASSLSMFKDASKVIEDYSFSADEQKMLIQTESKSIYRHSFTANYYIWDKVQNRALPLADFSRGQQRLAEFSPTGNLVAFVRDNNIFISDLEFREETQVTFDGKQNEIINGFPDWVYEEEFGFSHGFQWSPKGDRIAYYKFNESKVKQFQMAMYGDLYPDQYTYKYPKAGETNSEVSIFVYDINAMVSKRVDLGNAKDMYVPRIKWTQNNDRLCVMRLNRHQNHLEFLLTDLSKDQPFELQTEKIFDETSKTYIEISDDLTFLSDGNSFIWTSERDGYNHVYVFDMKGNVLRQLTSGEWDVIEFLGVSESKSNIFFTASRESAMQQHVYSGSLKKNKVSKLSEQTGTNDAVFSNTFEYYINYHSNANTPYYISLHNAKGKEIRMLKDNARLKKTLAEYDLAKKEFFTFTNSDNVELNCWMMKPANFDATKSYPVYVAIYGGPGHNTVVDKWEGSSYMWHQMLTQMGYIVVSCDPRGTYFRGRDFKHSTYMELGKLETQDFIDFGKHLGGLAYVDAARIGIQGWSYGGYMTSLCMTKGADVYKAGIAVAPVTNWRYYDSIYTERFMRTPQENPTGYDENSPINHVEKLKGPYLLVHGSGDDNVHYQNTMEMVDALVRANKQFDLFIYPNKNHGIYGGNTRLHLFTKMTNFIQENL